MTSRTAQLCRQLNACVGARGVCEWTQRDDVAAALDYNADSDTVPEAALILASESKDAASVACERWRTMLDINAHS